MDGSAVNSIIDRTSHPKTIKVNGVEHLVVPRGEGAHAVVDLPTPRVIPAPLPFRTLQGFADYLTKNRDGLPLLELSAQVHSHSAVSVFSPPFGEFGQRQTHATASYVVDAGFNFGHYMPIEDFIIGLQCAFVQSERVDAILRVVGNIKDESVRQVDDDGVTQTVTARVGAVMSKEVQVPNPVRLAPYRTFPEIEQPASWFVLRVRRGEDGDLPTCALFLADGDLWQLEAVASIKAWLVAHIPTEVAILA